MTYRVGSLFTGYDGLGMGLRGVLNTRTVWFSEIEPAAIKVLQYHWPSVPNLGDITTIDWANVDPVDILIGGFPCQDISSAGKRAGLRPDTRSGLWSHMAYTVSQLRPKLVVIENVRGLLSADAHCDLEPCPWCLGDNEGRPLRALGAVCGDLASLGYVGRVGGLRAAAVGAPHGRFRVFITARPAPDAQGEGLEGARPESQRSRPQRGDRTPTHPDRDAVWEQPECVSRRSGTPVPGRPGAAATDTSRGSYSNEPRRSDAERQPLGSVIGPGDRTSAGSPAEGVHELGRDASLMDWGPYGPAIHRWELILNRPAPAPTITGKRGGQQLSPRFVEWMMGLPEGHVTTVPRLSRNDQLKLLGNGVVPLQVAAALSFLLADRREVAA